MSEFLDSDVFIVFGDELCRCSVTPFYDDIFNTGILTGYRIFERVGQRRTSAGIDADPKRRVINALRFRLLHQ